MTLGSNAYRAQPRRSPFKQAILSACCWTICAPAAFAQQDVNQYQEMGKLIRAPQAVTALGNDLLGDQVNLYSGSLEFIQTDVSLPGNSALPVSMGRRLKTGAMAPEGTHFGRWEMEVPHLHGIFADGWKSPGAVPGARCSDFGAPPPEGGLFVNNQPAFAGTEFWHGSFIYVPGRGDQEMLRRVGPNTQAPGNAPSTYPVVTRDNWQFKCITTMANGGGEGFLALAPDGTTYRFDWMVSRAAPRLRKTHGFPDTGALRTGEAEQAEQAVKGGPALPSDPQPDSIPIDMTMISRSEVWILPTLITDRFGNTVTYTYDTTN